MFAFLMVVGVVLVFAGPAAVSKTVGYGMIVPGFTQGVWWITQGSGIFTNVLFTVIALFLGLAFVGGMREIRRGL